MKDTDFSEVHNAQVLAFDAALNMVDKENIKSFDQASIKEQIRDPILLIEATEMEIDEGKKGGSGLLWVKVKYQAHCVLSRAVKNVDLECLNFSALVLKTVNNNKWGLANVGAPEKIEAFPGRYSNNPKGFDSWVVSWWQTVAIGDSWQLSRAAADDVLISEAPNIGKAHINEYEILQDGFTNITTP